MSLRGSIGSKSKESVSRKDEDGSSPLPDMPTRAKSLRRLSGISPAKLFSMTRTRKSLDSVDFRGAGKAETSEHGVLAAGRSSESAGSASNLFTDDNHSITVEKDAEGTGKEESTPEQETEQTGSSGDSPPIDLMVESISQSGVLVSREAKPIATQPATVETPPVPSARSISAIANQIKAVDSGGSPPTSLVYELTSDVYDLMWSMENPDSAWESVITSLKQGLRDIAKESPALDPGASDPPIALPLKAYATGNWLRKCKEDALRASDTTIAGVPRDYGNGRSTRKGPMVFDREPQSAAPDAAFGAIGLRQSTLSNQPFADGQDTGNSQPKRLPGTVEHIWDAITEWAMGEDSVPLYFLVDGPGTGKTTLAYDLASHWNDHGLLAAGYLFEEEAPTATDFLTHTARSLCSYSRVKHEMELNIETIKSSFQRSDSFSNRWEYLVARPLSELVNHAKRIEKPLVVVIDALDHCKDGGKLIVSAILDMFNADESQELQRWIRFLVTTRPDAVIQDSLSGVTGCIVDRFSNHSKDGGDLIRYIRSRFSSMPATPATGVSLTGETADALAKHANGSFTYACVACDALEPSKTRADVLRVLLGEDSGAAVSGMEPLYRMILDRALDSEGGQRDQTIAVLQAVRFSERPQAVIVLKTLLAYRFTDVDIEGCIQRLAGLVKKHPESSLTSVANQSVRDFLDGAASTENNALAPRAGHLLLAGASLDVLLNHLASQSATTSTLEESNHLIPLMSSSAVQYGLRYWAEHVMKYLQSGGARDATGKAEKSSLFQNLRTLFEGSLFAMFELHGHLDNLPTFSDQIHRLREQLLDIWSDSAEKQHLQIIYWCNDIYRFLEENKSLLESDLGNLYTSALGFSDPSWLIHEHYASRYHARIPVVTWATVKQDTDHTHATHPEKPFVEADGANLLSFALGGRHLVSAHESSLLYAWDVMEGKSMGPALRTSKRPRAIACSHDLTTIAYADTSGTITFYKLTGSQKVVLDLLGGVTEGQVRWMAFSPNGAELAFITVPAGADSKESTSSLHLYRFPSGHDARLVSIEIGTPPTEPLLYDPTGRHVFSSGRAWNVKTRPIIELKNESLRMVLDPLKAPITISKSGADATITVGSHTFTIPTRLKPRLSMVYEGRLALIVQRGQILFVNCLHLLSPREKRKIDSNHSVLLTYLAARTPTWDLILAHRASQTKVVGTSRTGLAQRILTYLGIAYFFWFISLWLGPFMVRLLIPYL